jgi:hypothetical protein
MTTESRMMAPAPADTGRRAGAGSSRVTRVREVAGLAVELLCFCQTPLRHSCWSRTRGVAETGACHKAQQACRHECVSPPHGLMTRGALTLRQAIDSPMTARGPTTDPVSSAPSPTCVWKMWAGAAPLLECLLARTQLERCMAAASAWRARWRRTTCVWVPAHRAPASSG